MKRILLESLVLLCALVVGSMNVWAAEGDTHDFSQNFSQLLNNNASIDPINIAQQSYPIKKVVLSYRYNKTIENAVTVEVSVGGNSWGTQNVVGTGSNYTTMEFTGDATTGAVVLSFTNNTGDGTGHGTFYVNNVQLTEGAAGSNPSISANDISIAYNATSGSIEYTLQNADGNVSASVTTGDWLTLGSITASAVPFTCSANTGSTARTATVTLSYTGATDKVVTVTQNTITVDAPTISPAAGAVAAGTTVTLTQASADQIRYTTDGTAPTKITGTVYSAPITITTATTIKAIAIKNDVASDVAEAAYTISVTTPVFSPEPSSGSYYIEGMEVALTSAGNTIYYNMTTDGSEPVDPTSNSTQYTSPIALTNGTVKIRAIAYDSYGNTSNAITRTFKGVSPTALPFSWKGTSSKGKADLAAKTGVALNLGSDYAPSNAPYRLKFDGLGKHVTVFTNEQPGIVSFTAKLFNATTTGTKIKVQASVDGNEFTDIEEFTIDGEANETFEFTTTSSFAANQRVVKLVISSLDKNVAVGSINIDLPGPANPTTSGEETYLTTSDNMAGWRAFYDASNSYSVDAYTKVYVADTDPVGTTITLKAIEGIPTAVPVILHTSSSADNYKMTLTKETSTPYTYTGTNLLTWTASAVSNKYRLGYGASGVGFYPYSGTPASGAVILDVSSSVGAHELTIDFGENEVTAINEAKSQQPTANGQYYDLQGRKVANPSKGLYIVNGHKVIVK